MAEDANAVKPGEGTPPAGSAPANQPSDAGQPPASTPDGGTPPSNGGKPPEGGTPAGAKPGEGGEGRTVPYSRFQSVNQELTRLKSEKAAKSLVVGEAPAAPAAPATPPAGGGEGGGKPSSQYVTHEELEQNRRVDALATEAAQVASEHDGSDGYPAFDLDKVTEFMKDTGMRSYRYAYEIMNRDSIIEAEKAKAVKEAGKVNTPQTVTPGGSAFSTPPVQGELTREAIAKMSPEEYKKLGGAKGLRSKVLGGGLK